jgi:hypothetical protein
MKTGTMADLSRLMNVSRATVLYWRRRDKMRDLFLDDGKIDLIKALRVLPGRISAKHQMSVNRRWKKPTAKEIKTYKAMQEADIQKIDILEAQRLHENEKLLMARIRREELQGLLVRESDVDDEAGECALMVKNALMVIPDRISAQLAAETNEKKIRDLLNMELRQALKGLLKGRSRK